MALSAGEIITIISVVLVFATVGGYSYKCHNQELKDRVTGRR
jgi:hypothetical protein